MASSDKVLEARKRAEAQVKAQQRASFVLWTLVGLVVVALVVATIMILAREKDVETVSGEGQLVPVGATENGGFGVASSGVVGEGLNVAPARLDVYLDFMCPICGTFEETQESTLSSLRTEGVIDVYYHPISILDDYSLGTEYSTRAASAAVLVAEESPESFMTFVNLMMANQPAEGTTGLTDEQIQEIARAAGVPDAVVAKIPDHPYADWVTSATEQASKDGVRGTPTLAIDGEIQNPRENADHVNWGEPGALEKALREAAAN